MSVGDHFLALGRQVTEDLAAAATSGQRETRARVQDAMADTRALTSRVLPSIEQQQVRDELNHSRGLTHAQWLARVQHSTGAV